MVCMQSLCPALLNVRDMCWRFSDMGLYNINKITYTLADFKAAQIDKIKEVKTNDNMLQSLVLVFRPNSYPFFYSVVCRLSHLCTLLKPFV